jgi:nitrate/nitrite-specific signal transduction histidine kinase
MHRFPVDQADPHRAGLLVVALASIGLTLWVTWQLEGGAAAVNEAGRMRMQTWRLSSAVQAELPPRGRRPGQPNLTTA